MNPLGPILLASCRDLPPEEVDDCFLVAALERRGREVRVLPWDARDVAWSEAAACLPRTTWDYTRRLPAFRDWIDGVAEATRLFNEASLLRANLDKRYLRALEARGVPMIPTVWIEDGDPPLDPAALAREQGWTRGLLKPAVGAGSELTARFGPDEAAEARRVLLRARARGAVLLQPYLESVESKGEISVIFIAGAVTHAVRKVPVPGDYRVQDDFGARDLKIDLTPELETFGRGVLRAADAEDALYARVDLLRDPEGALRLVELELVEPSLFFRHAPEAADALAEALLARLEPTA